MCSPNRQVSKEKYNEHPLNTNNYLFHIELDGVDFHGQSLLHSLLTLAQTHTVKIYKK